MKSKMPTGDPDSTGDAVLDTMLRGGVPSNRSLLLTGGPGTGKSTLAMQFLQEGLDAGENALYVSTEQTVAEIRDAFSTYEFDLDHENLVYASVHATPGQTIESDDALTLQVLDGSAPVGGSFAPPFTAEYLLEYLDRYAPRDRVVFDSVSGLAPLADGPADRRRTMLDLIREFTDRFGATTLLTAEAADEDTVFRYATHGVVELRREPVAGDVHNFLEVLKLRGVDHDRRTVEVEFTEAGLRAAPARRSQPPAIKAHHHRPVGIEGLDALTGGGLVRGTGVLLRHDGRANLAALFGAMLTTALETDHAVTLVPTIGLREDRVRRMLGDRGHDLDDLLADGRIQVVDVIGGWDKSVPGVHAPEETTPELLELFTDIDGSSGKTNYTLLNGDALAHHLGPTAVRRLRYALEAELLGPDDSLVSVGNPDVVPDEVAAFRHDVAEQVVETQVFDDGLQYVTLRKSPCGFVGTTSLVEYVDDPPYLRVQAPPADRRDDAA
jgi:KaiC/GvpD/RAD55 family RecA-like ATPase